MDDCNSDIIEQARQLFMHCDTDDCGYLTRQALDRLSDRLPLTISQLDFVFNLLDKDKNGQLTLDEFIQGFGIHEIYDTYIKELLITEDLLPVLNLSAVEYIKQTISLSDVSQDCKL
ncbi:unnamed protein product [Schistosoma mattheei]|uniref:Uncharacterized protein n=1 Tax=Schistosoma mattheei TaxID=31246 RepID=A0A183P0D0_9TREM|nr:unnamed protein product [Schistosoma mattheei]